jgi:signal transduction histidine kinase
MNFWTRVHDSCFRFFYLGYTFLVAPKLQDSRLRQREFIYNGIIVASVGLLTVLLPFSVGGFVGVVAGLLVLFVLLFVVSRLGYVVWSWKIYLVVCFVISLVPSLYFGEIRIFGLVGLVVCIVLSGVFINRHGALVTSLFSWVAVLTFYNIKIVVGSGFEFHVLVFEVVGFCLLVGSMLMLSWMFNHDVKHFLRKGGSLEVVVTESVPSVTLPSDRLGELYRFAEFGRLAGSLFHDMANPLTALLLHLERMRSKTMFIDEQIILRESYDQMFGVAKQLDDFIVLVRKHGGAGEEERKEFTPSGEVVAAAQVFLHKMHKTGVSVRVEADETVRIFGSPLKFYQVVLNLISNAIDSYAGLPHDVVSRRGVVLVKLFRDGNFVVLSVQDFGSGIKPELLEKIFEPFYTTKPIGLGSGVGLATVKEIVEKEFNGSIEVGSEVGKGSLFRVIFRVVRG